MVTIYSQNGCPFAHRTHALLTHLEIPFELKEIDTQNRPPELLRLSPTGRVPFLVHGDFTLYESQIINDYLADTLEWANAYSADPGLRARQRLAMKQWDSTILPAGFYGAMRYPLSFDRTARDAVEKELDQLTITIDQMGETVVSLLAIHLASFWAQMNWLRDYTPLVEFIEARPSLKRWLDKAVAIRAVQKTLPNRNATAPFLPGTLRQPPRDRRVKGVLP